MNLHCWRWTLFQSNACLRSTLHFHLSLYHTLYFYDQSLKMKIHSSFPPPVPFFMILSIVSDDLESLGSSHLVSILASRILPCQIENLSSQLQICFTIKNAQPSSLVSFPSPLKLKIIESSKWSGYVVQDQ
jgi:hypothetical protein